MTTILHDLIEKHFNFELNSKQEKIFCSIYENLDDYLMCYKRIEDKYLDKSKILLFYDDKPIYCIKESVKSETEKPQSLAFALSSQIKIFELLKQV